MEALGVLKFWRSAAAGAEVRADVDCSRSTAAVSINDEETDDEGELFDLVLKSPNRGAVVRSGYEASRKDIEFVESPSGGGVLSKIDFSSSSKGVSTVTILRSAQKFKVKFVFGFRKSSSRCEKDDECNSERKVSTSLNQLSKSLSNGSCTNGRAAESSVAPVFARESSLRRKCGKESPYSETSSRLATLEKSVPRYLKLIKPLYVKVSQKVKLTDSATPSPSPVTAPTNLPPRKISEGSGLGSFKIVPRNLRKSRSASAAVGAELPPSARRRDDSLLQQHDGVESAILHCKKSYNSLSQELSQLSRSSSDPAHENLKAGRRNSGEDQNGRSI